MATASIRVDDIRSSVSDRTPTCGYVLWMRLRAVGLLSQTATTFEPSSWSRFLTTFGPQYPYPTTPNLMTESLLPLCIDLFEAVSRSWLPGCKSVDIGEGQSFLVRAIAENDGNGCAQQNLQVHPRRPGFRISQVQ